jgi:hypothetical protein
VPRLLAFASVERESQSGAKTGSERLWVKTTLLTHRGYGRLFVFDALRSVVNGLEINCG